MAETSAGPSLPESQQHSLEGAQVSRGDSEVQAIALALEKEKQGRLEAEQLAQTKAEEVAQLQSRLAEVLYDGQSEHEDPNEQLPDSGEEDVDGEPMSIQEAIDEEYDRLQEHRAGPDSGQNFSYTLEVVTLAAHMLTIV